MSFKTLFQSHLTHESAFIATGAVVVGDVTLGADTGIWFNAVLRGDIEPIVIEAGTNIQDLCMVHTDTGYPTHVGAGCTVGHSAIVHGATVGANTLIGMGAILLNGVEVGENCIVGAGSLLTQGKQFPAGTLILGSPAKVIRELTDDEIAANRQSAANYMAKAALFRDNAP
jgi:carbonic anhydrase/acetyltransferase-like protein (isoleucine patch superfamily)